MTNLWIYFHTELVQNLGRINVFLQLWVQFIICMLAKKEETLLKPFTF